MFTHKDINETSLTFKWNTSPNLIANVLVTFAIEVQRLAVIAVVHILKKIVAAVCKTQIIH